MGQFLFEGTVWPAMAQGVCSPARQTHELPRMGRWQFRRQSLLRSADARLVRGERAQYRLCGLCRRRRVMATANRQQPVSAVSEAFPKAFWAHTLSFCRRLTVLLTWRV